MKAISFFEIPDETTTRVRLVEAVPQTWSWMDGWLRAPEILLTSGAAIETTGFIFSRYRCISPIVVGKYDPTSGREFEPDLYAILAEQKLPGFIRFDMAGYGTEITLELAKRIAMAYLGQDYTGWLNFYSGCRNNNKYNNPAFCQMKLDPWCGAPLDHEEEGQQPSRIRLEWDDRYGGSSMTINPIVAVCRELELKQYTPYPNRPVGV
jgi:hypothetical protein